MRHLLLIVLFASAVTAADPLVEHALARDGGALRSLRMAGPSGLHAVSTAYDATSAPDNAAWDLLFDTIAAQRHARHSRLYWYTDLEQAKAAAAASGKPIVSLRLLGNLTDELSCANSRFFRALLYPDPAISAWLREKTILHWSSERPVPRVTINFGDGRTIETTITGNSAHYILDAEGRPIDVIPGLLAPQPFLESLMAAADLHRQLIADPVHRDTLLHDWHVQQVSTIDAELATCGIVLAKQTRPKPRPVAADAMPIAVSKSRVEMPVLSAIDTQPLLNQTIRTAKAWENAETHWLVRCTLPDSTLALLQHTYSFPVNRLGTVIAASPLQQLEWSLASDTARNAWDLHRTIHQWFVADDIADFKALNQRIYAKLFLTPASDPWLGLRSKAFDGIAR